MHDSGPARNQPPAGYGLLLRSAPSAILPPPILPPPILPHSGMSLRPAAITRNPPWKHCLETLLGTMPSDRPSAPFPVPASQAVDASRAARQFGLDRGGRTSHPLLYCPLIYPTLATMVRAGDAAMGSFILRPYWPGRYHRFRHARSAAPPRLSDRMRAPFAFEL